MILRAVPKPPVNRKFPVTRVILKFVGIDVANDASTAGFATNALPSAQRETAYSTNG
jgi:hypothetical protein